MGVREMATDRLVSVTARLLTAASLLTTVGIGFTTWTAWQQTGQSYGPDGSPIAAVLPFTTKLSMAVFESSFRPGGLQLLLAAVLLAGSVVALHLHPTRTRVRSLRWEVLGAGVVALVLVTVFLLANVFVLTAPASGEGEENWFGPQPISHVAWANLAILTATLLLLVVAALWWLRVAPAADAETQDEDDDDDDDDDDEDESAFASDQDSPEAARGVHADGGRSSEPVKDYSRDWSPEDFRPPR